MGEALAAHGETPRITRKPGEFLSEFTFEAAPGRHGKAADLEEDARGVEERVPVLAAHLDPIPHPGDGLAAGAAKQNPATGLIQLGAVLIGHDRALAGKFAAPETNGCLREHAPPSTVSLP